MKLRNKNYVPNIAIGDFNIKLKKAEECLKNGNKVKISNAI